MKKRILLDLDGVLNTYDGKYDESDIPPVKQGARDFLQNLSKEFDIILFTCRYKLLVFCWLRENRLDKYIKGITNEKMPAYLYIDDRAICFKGDYEKLLGEIKKFSVYWNKEPIA